MASQKIRARILSGHGQSGKSFSAEPVLSGEQWAPFPVKENHAGLAVRRHFLIG